MEKEKYGKERQPSENLTYLRKIKKPLVEKRRRERINTSLHQLKQILLENIKMHGGTQVSKLDKADILELAVSYLRQHQQKSVAMATHSYVKQEYVSSHSESANGALDFSHRTASSNIGTILNESLNRRCVPDMTPLSSGGYVLCCVPTLDNLDLIYNVKQETDNFVLDRDSNGNFTDGYYAFSSAQHAANDTVYKGTGYNLASSSSSVHSNSATCIQSNDYFDSANTYQQTTENIIDSNGNWNLTEKTIPSSGENDASEVTVDVDNNHDNSDDEEDRLFIHIEDNADVNNENINRGHVDYDDTDVNNENINQEHVDNDIAERDDVWRPW